MITGANAKIQVADTTLAYASDVSYTLNIDHIPVEVMNKYEVVSNEPVSMTLSGSFSVVRYSKAATIEVPLLDDNGNPVSPPKTTTKYVPGESNSPNEWTHDKSKLKPFSPGDLLASKTFDITITQRYVDANGKEQDVNFLKFKDCRITGRSTSLNKRSVMVERFDFIGETMDDDKITSAGSGDDDLS